MLETLKRLNVRSFITFIGISLYDARRAIMTNSKTERRYRIDAIRNRVSAVMPSTKDHNGIMNIGNFKIEYISLWELLFLQNEVFSEQEYYFKSRTSSPKIIDCGSNIGMSILYIKSLYPDSSIIGFEPNKMVFDVLERNMSMNNVQGVTLINKALSDHEGTIQFFQSNNINETLDNSCIKEGERKSVSVECTRLSNYINSQIDLLKIDVEGLEYQLLEELKSNDKLKFIDLIIMEFHCNKIHDVNPMLKMLESEGFDNEVKSNTPKHIKPGTISQYIIYSNRRV